ncbi:MAG: vacuolar family H+-ATPase subunit H [Lachnospiraceae bacterium]|nr:vacuolar family H+-ATPase subunit H [Lachnospiraceae bacterium]
MASENASVSAIEEIIGEIEVYIDSCKYQPLSNTKIIVNKEEMDELLRELRLKVPEEVRRYQKIIVNKEAIMNDARTKAKALLDETAVQSNELVSEHEIMKQAYAQANVVIEDAAKRAQGIIDDAMRQANSMKQSAAQYTDKLLREFETVVGRTIGTTERSYESFMNQLVRYQETVRGNREDLKPSLQAFSAPAQQQRVVQPAQAVQAEPEIPEVQPPEDLYEAGDYAEGSEELPAEE